MVCKADIMKPHSSESVVQQRCTIKSSKTNLNFGPEDIPISEVGHICSSEFPWTKKTCLNMTVLTEIKFHVKHVITCN